LVFPGIGFAEVLTKISCEDEPFVGDERGSQKNILPPQEVKRWRFHTIHLVKKKFTNDDTIATINVMAG
jgi:hypothetical protein